MPGDIGPRADMPRQDPRARARNFNEVALGYTPDMALEEARRCIQCKKPVCISGCPVEIDIKSFIGHIQEGDFLAAIKKIKETNSLPAVCGRVCPQEDQCELKCILGKKYGPVAIGRLERFVADWERANQLVSVDKPAHKKSKRVAVVGSGPAGLSAASELAKRGYGVTIFEALHRAGGVLVYGIPEFRLPKAIVQAEIDYIQGLGVELRTSVVIGKTCLLDELRKNYDAVFLGTGAGLPRFMGIKGENLNGIYSANEYLTRSNLMKAYLFPEWDTPIKIGRRVGVVGGGNVAMDAARTALRLGAEEVYLIYRRSREEMPARQEEIENAKEEGIQFKLLTNPVGCLGENRNLRAIRCIKMELGEPDESGRRRPVPVVGSEFDLEVDIFVVAIGQGPNPLVPRTTRGLETTKNGNIVVDQETLMTSLEGVFAGGDIVTGAATVILAMGAGRTAARSIDEYLSSP
ncbi:glutamate synthase (NADPH) small chain [Candidatus Hakubella thermalkaliphila]|uniref:Glutamate synthase (NADPH) small chain n=2 Tax=Candidatus Hakubella thermalkaliphila TaxID=2754717 RepID=A0A6V8NXL5_9ACTN|nr:NADPH-dependent glutamate synthase [Candidatus Hakubella thermalkaliphila]GFP23276.1 glutamate synthase (NADPH) small chain [Candidatus Hakubella thermalkaliphila]GFP30843.1 glutamate synthase (NADPH) small chain [Candidatus Hakubella thermalkaliphila]GFP36859.1 glutamate synthase (NADPH) small chain [Candidatus Hakubella thermalkaliphila]